MSFFQAIENAYRKLNNITVLKVTTEQWVMILVVSLTMIAYQITRSNLVAVLAFFIVWMIEALIRRRPNWRKNLLQVLVGSVALYVLLLLGDRLPSFKK